MSLNIDGYAAYSADGQPVRRVATNGNMTTPPSHDWSGVCVVDLPRLFVDASIYGDAWVDMAGRRVDPQEVTVKPL